MFLFPQIKCCLIERKLLFVYFTPRDLIKMKLQQMFCYKASKICWYFVYRGKGMSSCMCNVITFFERDKRKNV